MHSENAHRQAAMLNFAEVVFCANVYTSVGLKTKTGLPISTAELLRMEDFQ